MVKRIFQLQLDHQAKIRRKSLALDETSKYHPNNLVDDDEANDEHDQHDDDKEKEQEEEQEVKSKPSKIMKYVRLNQNNEIERLLLYNSKTLYYHVDHCDFPSFNVGLWPQEDSKMLTTYPSLAFSVPRPIYVAEKQCEKVDLCYKRVMNRHFHKKRIAIARSSYKTAHKKKKVLRTSEKDGIYHTSVFDMAERVLLQPDTYFNGSYDHYFTGGNLSILPQSGNIIHAGGEQLKTLAISEFPILEDYNITSSLLNVASQESSEESELFEVRPLLLSPNSSRQNCFVTRQRNVITFNYLNDNTKQLKILTQFRTKSTPFISFAQSERDINNFIMTTMKQHVRLYDLSANVPKLVKLYEIAPDKQNISWNTVKPWREHTFLYANERQFFLIDTRTTPEQWMDSITLNNPDSFICDHISSIKPSEFNNLFYVATNHKLYCMDIRNMKKFAFNDTKGAICRWSHQLRYAPLMMDTLRLRQTEYIAISSAIAGDLHICQLSRQRNDEELTLEPTVGVTKHIYSSKCLPYQPPSLLEAYESARLAGKCLRPESNLEARLKCCTTGLTFYNSSLNNTEATIGLLLTSNSNGDIFSQTITKRDKNEATEIRCNTDSDNMMAEFETKICEQTQPPLNYTEIRNMKSLRKIFLCNSLSSNIKYDLDAMADEYSENELAETNNENPTTQPTLPIPAASLPPPRRRLHLGRWQKSFKTLHSYKDALVPDLLSIWDIDMEEDKNHIRLGNLQSSRHIKPDATSKVNDWLNTALTPNPPMLTIPNQSIAKFNSSNTNLTTENLLNITDAQNTTIDFINVVHSTQIMDYTANVSTALDTSGLEVQIHNEKTTTIVEKLKTKKKTKKYVKGF